jgi:RHS repeat-associated protein
VEERTTYDWDGRDKLRTITKPDGTRLDYSYDVFGRRVSKTRSGGPLDGKRVEFLWDGEVLAWELDTERGPRAFVHEPGGFEPVLQQQGGETYLCVNDHLGMPKELIDGEGRLAWAAAHSAYGAVIATQGPDDVAVDGGFVRSDGPRVESPFRLLGQVNDDDADLSWTRFRCFDAETGTWISTDPLEIAGGLALYGFDGSPTSVVDPLGFTTGTRHQSAAERLPQMRGMSIPEAEQTLRRNGFTQDKVSNSAAKNQTWSHPDGSEVRIHPYGNEKDTKKNGTQTPKSGLNAHIHKEDPHGNQLTDRGVPSTNLDETHIGLKNPNDLPSVRPGRQHGDGA